MSTKLNLIDVGTPGDETSGDTINEGGKKINLNFMSLWKTFGSDSEGDLIATLPFKKGYDFTNQPLRRNTQYDVDTTNGSIVVRLSSASSLAYKTGDVIVLRDPRGTWRGANVALIFQDDEGSVHGSNSLTFRHDYSKVTLTCVDGNTNRWIYSVSSGRESTFSEVNFIGVVTPSTPIDETLYRTNIYHSMKFLLTITSNANQNEKSIAEILVTDDGTAVDFVEYANINTSTTREPIANISFYMVNEEVFVKVEAIAGYPSCTVQMKEIEKVERIR